MQVESKNGLEQPQIYFGIDALLSDSRTAKYLI